MVLSCFIGGTTGVSWLLICSRIRRFGLEVANFGTKIFHGSFVRLVLTCDGVVGAHGISGSAGDGHGGLDVGGELLLVFGQGAEVALDLDAVPEFRRLAEECSKTDGHGGRDGSAGVDDLVDGAGRDADGAGHGVLGNAHGIQVFLQQDLAGCDGWIHRYNVSRYRGASMVIANRDLGWAVIAPNEDDPPLVVDADRVVTRQISLQGFESVSGRDCKILENPRPVHLDQFA